MTTKERVQEMNNEQAKRKTIYIGYHPRTHDGSSPQTHSQSEAIAIMENFNKSQKEDRLRAEVFEIACSDLCAVAVMETTIDKVWQYI